MNSNNAVEISDTGKCTNTHKLFIPFSGWLTTQEAACHITTICLA